jgi:3',5'-cyclic AMP phosphodiesterase CpdA
LVGGRRYGAAVGSIRIVVVSDSHLSERTPEAAANWRAVVDDLAADAPDVVVHAGDISTDGALRPAELDFARGQLDLVEQTGVRLLTLPGNHDMGDNPFGDLAGPHAPDIPDRYAFVTPGLLARYREAFGPDRWIADVGGWRLVGLDAQLLGSGLPDEDEQWAWLSEVAAAMAAPGGGPEYVALFLHKPLADPPDRPDGASPHRYVVPQARERLAQALAAVPVRTVVSGHVHQYRRHAGPMGYAADGGSPVHVWAPSSWAVLPDRIQPVLGEKVCGVAELVLGDDGTVGVELRRPPGLVQQVIADDIPDPYEG